MVEMDVLGLISRIVWSTANAVYVISVASTVAFLDSVNKRFVFAACNFTFNFFVFFSPPQDSDDSGAKMPVYLLYSGYDQISTLLHPNSSSPLRNHFLWDPQLYHLRSNIQSHFSHCVGTCVLVGLDGFYFKGMKVLRFRRWKCHHQGSIFD